MWKLLANYAEGGKSRNSCSEKYVNAAKSGKVLDNLSVNICVYIFLFFFFKVQVVI